MSDFVVPGVNAVMADLPFRFAAAAILLLIEIPLALIAYRATGFRRSFLGPVGLLIFGALVPDPNWSAVLLFVSLLWMFFLAIVARTRQTRREEERQLASSGPSPWIGQSRRSSLALIGAGCAMIVVAIAVDSNAPAARVTSQALFGWGSIMLGIGLFRRHTVLVLYLGRLRARRLEFVQVLTAFTAYGLALVGEFASQRETRLEFHMLSLIPFALHFLLVWVPLAKAQERAILPETPFA
jgi:hypothetical protein